MSVSPRPHVIVIGNYKGGSGKSTVAMHVIVALLKAGRRVASIDLDSQRTLTRYIENRCEWANQKNLQLEVPEHRSIGEVRTESRNFDAEAEIGLLVSVLQALQDGFDFIVIDTPGGDHHLSLLAHGVADTLVTPINDSFVDLDVIVTMAPSSEFEPQPSRYAEAVVGAASAARLDITGKPTNWVVIRNRLSPLASHNSRQVGEVLELMGPKVGFRTAPGLSERVVFREFFPVGLTAFDKLDEAFLGVKPTMSHLRARAEVRELLLAIGLPVDPSVAHQDGEHADDVDEVSGPTPPLLPSIVESEQKRAS